MDQPNLDRRLHEEALQALDRIHMVSATSQQFWCEMAFRLKNDSTEEHRGAAQSNVYSLLDVACGSGGLLLRLWKRALRAGLSLRLAGCDQSATALAVARRRCKAQGVDIELEQIDVTQQGFARQYDFVVSSLFLHHLANEQAETLLRRMAEATRLALIAIDLRRTRLGYLLAWAGTRLVSGSRVAHVDGPRSVARAFTNEEVTKLAAAAGLRNATVNSCWPQQFKLCWSPQ